VILQRRRAVPRAGGRAGTTGANSARDPARADDAALARIVAVVNANADKLNERMLSYRDYAVVARR